MDVDGKLALLLMTAGLVSSNDPAVFNGVV